MKKLAILLCLAFTLSCSGTIDHFAKLDKEMKIEKDECLSGKRMDCWGDPAGGGGGGPGCGGGK